MQFACRFSRQGKGRGNAIEPPGLPGARQKTELGYFNAPGKPSGQMHLLDWPSQLVAANHPKGALELMPFLGTTYTDVAGGGVRGPLEPSA